LDAEVLRAGLLDEISEANEGRKAPSAMTRKILEGLATEESDVLMYLDTEGNLALRSIVVRSPSYNGVMLIFQNLDRKPPTLIKSLPIARIRISDSLNPISWSPRSQLLHVPATSSLLAFSPALDRIEGYRVSLTDLISGRPAGFQLPDSITRKDENIPVQLQHPLHHFVRTPNGRGLLAICEEGEIGVWSKEKVGRPTKGKAIPKSLAGKGHWTMPHTPRHSAIFAKGRAIVFYTKSDTGATITLQHLDPGKSSPTQGVPLPAFKLEDGDDVAMLLAVSDIDDGISAKHRRTQRAVIMAVTKSGQTWTWRVTSLNGPTTSNEALGHEPDIRLLHTYLLPVQGGSTPALVLPVDPMGWHTSVIDWKSDTPLQDMVLTISENGVLEYWKPRLGQHLANQDNLNGAQGEVVDEGGSLWIRSGFVDTGRTNVIMARCSSRKKTVLSKLMIPVFAGRADKQYAKLQMGDRRPPSGIQTSASSQRGSN
jgi:hypothetical protein